MGRSHKKNILMEPTEKWLSPSKGVLTFNQMMDTIQDYTDITKPENKDIADFQVVVATDSQAHGRVWKFSSTICIHRMTDEVHGKGGVYFVKNEYFKHMESLKQKIVTEAGLTVTVADALQTALVDRGIDLSISLHFDVSEDGDSRIALKDVKNMANGTQLPYSIKPYSWAASYVANKYTK